jgi:hypothetical protein
MFDGPEAVSVTLTAAEWNVVIAALLAYRPGAPVVQKIGEQARLQDGEATHASD